jgi:poly(A) polymerase/tRNA nucleotidyltransferase (CCA-adding enzyme)
MPRFVRFVIQRLKQAGFPAFVVGGAPRDILLNRRPADWDLATPASKQAVITIFGDVRHFTLKHDTVTLVDERSRRFEITPFRKGRRDIREDLSKRDFTINAIAFDPGDSRFLDPFHGREDLMLRRIRGVVDPAERFSEDPIRLLRAVRLAAELGFRIETDTLRALSSESFRIASEAPERIRDELAKLLVAPRPSAALQRMVATGLMGRILPELEEGVLKRQNRHHRYTIFKHALATVDRAEPRLRLRLACLLHDVAKPRVREKVDGGWRFYGHEEESARMAVEILERLRFPKALIREVTLLIRHHMIDYDGSWREAAVRRLIRRVGAERVDDLLALRKADLLAHGLDGEGTDRLNELAGRIWEQMRAAHATGVKHLAVDGRDVMKTIKLPAGPGVGRVLQELLELVTDHPELNRKRCLMGILREKAKAGLPVRIRHPDSDRT